MRWRPLLTWCAVFLAPFSPSHPRLSEEAGANIAKFYATLRSQEVDNKTLPVTARTLETLIRLASAHAKVCRRAETLGGIDGGVNVVVSHTCFCSLSRSLSLSSFLSPPLPKCLEPTVECRGGARRRGRQGPDYVCLLQRHAAAGAHKAAEAQRRLERRRGRRRGWRRRCRRRQHTQAALKIGVPCGTVGPGREKELKERDCAASCSSSSRASPFAGRCSYSLPALFPSNRSLATRQSRQNRARLDKTRATRRRRRRAAHSSAAASVLPNPRMYVRPAGGLSPLLFIHLDRKQT